ncbi:MAG: SLBB domain-containing protein, partial [Bacteroidetes bacterium]|nr:SLBB domain-containing protein [Bacteroidota bacterium]
IPLTSVFAQMSNLTPQQLQQRAAAMGYNVDTNQVKQYEQSQSAGTNPLSAPAAPVQVQTAVTPPAPGPSPKYLVSAFANRPGADSLPAFGYNVFTYSPTTFQPTLNVPTPVNYVIGPGDEIVISLWGETQLVQDLTVSKNGDVYIPNVGLISVNGLDMKQLREKLFNRLSKVYASLLPNASGGARTHLNISTGQLRSVKIYVLGEVKKPGGYTLPALSSAFTALYYSGGPDINGTLRNIEVLRDGKVVDHIDLYDYLISGDQSQDIRLNDGDIVFVPPVGKRVAIRGSVFRPAIYELKKEETLGDLLKYASGLTFNAYFQTVHIDRVIPFNQRADYENNILSIDLNFKSVAALDSSKFKLDDGDVVTIDTINNRPQNMVSISGDVRQPGVYELTPGMTVRDLISRADSVFPDAFMGEAMLIRTLPSEKKEMLSFNLGKALAGNPSDNLSLANLDSIHIFRDTTFFPTRWVQIFGNVRRPGTYHRYQNMTLSDLIIRAGGLNDSATTQDIEVARIDTVSSDIYATKITVNLPEDYWDVPSDREFMLKDYDKVLIRPDTAKTFENGVYLKGEVVILRRGEKLSDFIKRAGGFMSGAYPEGMYVLRYNPLIQSLRPVPISDTTFLRVYSGQPLINRSQFNAQFGNRIPIIWKDVAENRSSIYNLRLMPNDTVVVPPNPHTVTVVGDVGLPSTVPYKEGAGLSYYVNQAGGYTSTSAEGREIVILPNGMKWHTSGFFLLPNPPILSGTTIYVPSYIKTTSDVWPIIRDIITVVSSTAVLVLTISKL